MRLIQLRVPASASSHARKPRWTSAPTTLGGQSVTREVRTVAVNSYSRSSKSAALSVRSQNRSSAVWFRLSILLVAETRWNEGPTRSVRSSSWGRVKRAIGLKV